MCVARHVMQPELASVPQAIHAVSERELLPATGMHLRETERTGEMLQTNGVHVVPILENISQTRRQPYYASKPGLQGLTDRSAIDGARHTRVALLAQHTTSKTSLSMELTPPAA